MAYNAPVIKVILYLSWFSALGSTLPLCADREQTRLYACPHAAAMDVNKDIPRMRLKTQLLQQYCGDTAAMFDCHGPELQRVSKFGNGYGRKQMN
jgi:hypothetical protein